MAIDKITSPISELELIKKTNEIIDYKQDTLTEGTGISVTQAEDTRSTASIVTAGTNRWQGVAYGNGVYVAVGNNGYTSYSFDGSTWSTPTTVGSQSWYSVTFGNGKFVAVGNQGYTATTEDGVTWTTPAKVTGLSNRLQSVRYGNGIFVAVGWDAKSTISADGINWATPVSFPGTITRADSVSFDGSSFCVLGCNVQGSGSSATYADKVYSSTDGETWSLLGEPPFERITTAIIHRNGLYIAGDDAGYVSYSTDGSTWSTPLKVLDCVQSFSYNEGTFIAVGNVIVEDTTRKYSTIISTNGTTWSSQVDIGEASSSIQYGLLSVTHSIDNVFCAVGDYGATTIFSLSDNKTYISALVDSALSTTSTNPVQNNVVTAELNKKGTVKTINNIAPDNNGNVTITIPDTTNFVTTNTAQNITGAKSFVGGNKLILKQDTATSRPGFIIADPDAAEVGSLQYRPDAIGNNAMLNLNSPGTTYLGFRYWGTSSTTYNLLMPLPLDANTEFTAGNYYFPLGFTDGTNTVLTANSGMVDISSLVETPVYTATNPALTASEGKCTWTVTHNLGSQNVQVSIFDTSTSSAILFDSYVTSANAVSIELISASNISAGAYKVVVIGA